MIAGIYHETHTFLDGRTYLRDFSIMRGSDILCAPDPNSPIGAAVLAGRRLGWTIVPVIDLRAMPGPTVDDEVVGFYWEAFTEAAQLEAAKGVEGIFLVLHGAMVSESVDDVEGELLERMRSLPVISNVPICGVLDLHANFTQRMADHSDGLIAYRMNPHVDAKAATEDAVFLLDRLMRTRGRPTTVWEHPPLMWPPTGTGTDFDPMRSLESQARRIENEDSDLIAVNVLGGFAFSEIPETGVSFTAITRGDPSRARDSLRRLGSVAVKQRRLGCPKDISIDEAMGKVARSERGPIVLAEPSDNIGAGAPGDGVALLRAMVEHKVKNSLVVINDPKAAAAVRQLRKGERTVVGIGGKGYSRGPGPLFLNVELVSTSDGKFALEDSNSHLASMAGSQFDMGPCAVVRHNGVIILLTSRKTPPFDLGQLRSQGIKVEMLSVIVVKAAVAHRRAYGPIAAAHYSVETPGPCTSNLSTLPYSKVARPIYPLDEIGEEIEGKASE